MQAALPSTRVNDTRVRAPRYETSDSLVVESKTIGTDITYNLLTTNVSRSGLFAKWTHRLNPPFLLNTILEMEISPVDKRSAPTTLRCLGKIVRLDKSDGHAFGIQIIQMDNDSLVAWEQCISLIEKTREDLDNHMSEKAAA